MPLAAHVGKGLERLITHDMLFDGVQTTQIQKQVLLPLPPAFFRPGAHEQQVGRGVQHAAGGWRGG
jgi:hypothetical protein